MNTETEAPGSEENRDYFELMQTCKLSFRTLEDLALIKDFTNRFFAQRKNIVTGVHALALNAIEHGNLEIGYEMKAELLAEQIWEQEIHKRLAMPEYKSRLAELTLTRKDGGIYLIISDEGKGFAWQKFLAIDPGRAGQKHGRGIAIANTLSFDKLSYNEVGNQAIAFVAGPVQQSTG